MKLFTAIFLCLIPFLLTACGADNALTKQEMVVQHKADSAVAGILFDSGLDDVASYNVHIDGHVEIEFAKSVSMVNYTIAVEKMRKHPDIKSVSAEQSGAAVCIMK